MTVDDGNDGVDSAAFTWTVSESTDPLVDLGDLPEGIGFSYFTTDANNGPRHNLSASGPLLGSQVDPEIDGGQTTNALGDDNSDADDEDGVTFNRVNEEIEVVVANVAVGQTALLGAWFDWNNDGDFGDDNEFQSFTVNPGSNTLPVVVDPGYTSSNLYARFRIFSNVSAAGGSLDVDDSVGLATDGEVEDYLFNTCRWLSH